MANFEVIRAELEDAEAELNSLRADNTRLESSIQAERSAHEAEVAELEEEIAALKKQLEGSTPSTKTWFIGMATEKSEWEERANQVGHPVNVRRRFSGNAPSAATMVSMAKECHDVGCLPFISMKLGGSSSIDGWTRAANGSYDAQFEQIGRDLGALGYKVRASYHHEPRPATTDELVVWGRALTRAFTRMRAGAGATNSKNLILGPIDNGFPWSAQWKGNVTKADLDRYYTDTFLASCDVMGADFYDGATNTNPGEPAWVKMDGFRKYFDARGFTGVNSPGWKYDCGEFQVVDPEDMDALWAFLTSDAGKDFNNLAIFNSAANNRPDIPDRIGGTWVLSGSRLDSFRKILVAANVKSV